MCKHDKTQHWSFQKELVRLVNPFVTLIGERWFDEASRELDYWRVEKADSVIVLPIYRDQLIALAPMFRPGILRSTIDFPGGRLPTGKTNVDAALEILERELGVTADAVTHLQPLNQSPWVINSSFSNQGLWAFVAQVDTLFNLNQSLIGMRAPTTQMGVRSLLEKIECLQCRAVLQHWAMTNLLN